MITKNLIFFSLIFTISLSGMNEHNLSSGEQEVIKKYYNALVIVKEMQDALLKSPEGQFALVASLLTCKTGYQDQKEYRVIGGRWFDKAECDNIDLFNEVIGKNVHKKVWLSAFLEQKRAECFKKGNEALSSRYAKGKLLDVCSDTFQEQGKMSFLFDKPMSYEWYEKSVYKRYQPQLQEKLLVIK